MNSTPRRAQKMPRHLLERSSRHTPAMLAAARSRAKLPRSTKRKKGSYIAFCSCCASGKRSANDVSFNTFYPHRSSSSTKWPVLQVARLRSTAFLVGRGHRVLNRVLRRHEHSKQPGPIMPYMLFELSQIRAASPSGFLARRRSQTGPRWVRGPVVLQPNSTASLVIFPRRACRSCIAAFAPSGVLIASAVACCGESFGSFARSPAPIVRSFSKPLLLSSSSSSPWPPVWGFASPADPALWPLATWGENDTPLVWV